MKKRQKGSITVEATLFLPLFFLAFVSIYSRISFTRAQLIVQYAADQAAKEVAQYSYILEKIGILDSLDGLNSRSEDFEKNIKSIEEQLQTVQQAGENALNGEDPVGNTIEAGKAAKDAYGTVSGYVDDPESFISGVLAVFKKDAINGISTYMVNTVAKSCVMKQLSVAGGGQDPLTYAEKLGISDMNMSKTVWCQNKTRDIKIIVDFNMNNQVPFFRMKPRHYRVCASTRVWSGV